MTFAEAFRIVDAQFEVISPLEQAECERRLKVATVSAWYPMAGAVGGKIRSESILLRKFASSDRLDTPFKPFLFGKMRADGHATRIWVTIGMHPFMRWIYAFWGLFSAVVVIFIGPAALTGDVSLTEAVPFFLVVLCSPLLVWWGRSGSEEERRVLETFLLQTIEGTKAAR